MKERAHNLKKRVLVMVSTITLILMSGIFVLQALHYGVPTAHATSKPAINGKGWCYCPDWYDGCKCNVGGQWASGKWIPAK